MSTSSGHDKAPKPQAKAAGGPKTVDMVVEAVTNIADRKGASIQAIKTYILEKYPNVDSVRLKTSLKKAIVKGMESGILIRPKATEGAGPGLTGRFKVDKAKLAIQTKEKKPKKSTSTPKAKPPKSPKKVLAKKSPAAKKKLALPKTKAAAAKAKVDKTKATKAKAAAKVKADKPKLTKGPKTPKTPAKVKKTAKVVKAKKAVAKKT